MNQKHKRWRELLDAPHVADWLSDPLARGAYSYVMVNGHHARRALEPIEDTLWLVGAASNTGDQASTVASALGSGERRLNQSPKSRAHAVGYLNNVI